MGIRVLESARRKGVEMEVNIKGDTGELVLRKSVGEKKMLDIDMERIVLSGIFSPI